MSQLRVHDHDHGHDHGLALPAALSCELRRDARQRDAVARAVAMLGDSGVRPALEYLKAQAVRPRVIERVLLEPDHRRAPV